ncbi:MAG: hypothetical protein AAF153_02835, partial [Pseudomonadota bacterium]
PPLLHRLPPCRSRFGRLQLESSTSKSADTIKTYGKTRILAKLPYIEYVHYQNLKKITLPNKLQQILLNK